MKTRKAVYAGSFDPITNGHLNIIERMSKLYDELDVVVSVDSRKKYMFSLSDRMDMIKETTSHLSNIFVQQCVDRYVVKYAEAIGAQVLIRGLRNSKDLEDEQLLAEENRNICTNVETLWVPTLPKLMYVSSTLVKGHIGIDPEWEKEVNRLVPKEVFSKIKEKFMTEKAREHWNNLMSELGNPKSGEEILNSIVKRYSEDHRTYHNLQHIVSMLDEFESVSDIAENAVAIKLAIWYHDSVYETETKNLHVIGSNEDRSAYLAEQDLEKLGFSRVLIEKVVELILATKHKNTGEILDKDTKVMLDLDLSILGKDENIFNLYEEGIRKEYGWIPEADFCKGRSDILKNFLRRSKIYLTEFFREKYESNARKNMERSIEKLEI